MALTDCPPSFKIVKLGDLDAERNAINAGFQAILRCMASSSLPSPTGHSGEWLTTDGTNIYWASLPGGSGTVTSVGISTGTSGVPVTGSPVTTSGTITLALGTMANMNDAPSDGTVYGRQNGAWAATGGGASDGAITVQIGPSPGILGAILSSQVVYLQAPADYTITGWQAFCYPAATCTFDVWKASFPTLPTVANSITGGSSIGITSGSSSTGTSGGWSSTSITRGDWIAVTLASNDVATFISFQVQGDKA